jgi:hypothetical protein
MKPSEEIAAILGGPNKTDPLVAQIIETGTLPPATSRQEIVAATIAYVTAHQRAIGRIAEMLDSLIEDET